MTHTTRPARALVLGASAVLSACVTPPPRTPVGPPPPPDTTVFFYPSHGQTAQQQDRDKYECNNWAVRESGFDPSAPATPPHLRMQVASAPAPGSGAAAGAIGGAALGALVASPWNPGAGALFGALTGAAVGSAAESGARQQAEDVARANNAHMAALEGQSLNFRRAMSACLEARGYNVR
jgi:hypothetical protein